MKENKSEQLKIKLICYNKILYLDELIGGCGAFHQFSIGVKYKNNINRYKYLRFYFYHFYRILYFIRKNKDKVEIFGEYF